MAAKSETDPGLPAMSDANHPGGSRVYIIGAGRIALDHAAAAAGLQALSVLSVADPDPVARGAFLRAFPQTRMFDDADAMLGEPAQPGDIVVVATPHSLHRTHVVAAFRSGRHVLCEKPLAMNMSEAAEMLAEANHAGRLLGCCSVRFLGLAATEEAKRAVESGELGAPYHATFVNRQQRARAGIEIGQTAHWFLDRSRAGGGTLMAWSPYDITTLNHVLDPIRVEVRTAWMSNPTTAVALPVDTIFDTEQHIGASLRYHRRDGNVINVTFERAACTHGEERNIVEVEGTRGAVSWDWIDWLGDGEVTVTRDDHGKAASVSRTLGAGGINLSYRPLVYFHDRVAGRPSLAVVNEQAVFNFACLQAIYECAESGRPQTVELGGAA